MPTLLTQAIDSLTAPVPPRKRPLGGRYAEVEVYDELEMITPLAAPKAISFAKMASGK
jgi:hypothetical protein